MVVTAILIDVLEIIVVLFDGFLVLAADALEVFLFGFEEAGEGGFELSSDDITPADAFKPGVLFDFMSTVESESLFGVFTEQFPYQVLSLITDIFRNFDLIVQNV